MDAEGMVTIQHPLWLKAQGCEERRQRDARSGPERLAFVVTTQMRSSFIELSYSSFLVTLAVAASAMHPASHVLRSVVHSEHDLTPDVPNTPRTRNATQYPSPAQAAFELAGSGTALLLTNGI